MVLGGGAGSNLRRLFLLFQTLYAYRRGGTAALWHILRFNLSPTNRKRTP